MSNKFPFVEDINLSMDLHVRDISEKQMQKFEGYAAEILSAFGMDLNTPSTKDTPRRFVRALFDATEGYDGDPRLLKTFPAEGKGGPGYQLNQIVEGPINFFALCEHHAFPFYGQAFVGYIADANIIGISKLTRLVRLFGKRFAVQERIGRQVADTLMTMLHPFGAAIYLEAHHLCVEMRGVRAQPQVTRTTFWRGVYENDPALRSEFLTVCDLQNVKRL